MRLELAIQQFQIAKGSTKLRAVVKVRAITGFIFESEVIRKIEKNKIKAKELLQLSQRISQYEEKQNDEKSTNQDQITFSNSKHALLQLLSSNYGAFQIQEIYYSPYKNYFVSEPPQQIKFKQLFGNMRPISDTKRFIKHLAVLI
ncbi:hypothetical protein ABPG74_020610 [Tetrahymena malaccensis]